jgi:hypothetical protein
LVTEKKNKLRIRRAELHKGVTTIHDMSLEQIHSLCSNGDVNSDDPALASKTIGASGKLIAFADLRLPQALTGLGKVLIEYEDRKGVRSFHRVSLTCKGTGRGGMVYLGGYDSGKFSIFRADGIHRVTGL